MSEPSDRADATVGTRWFEMTVALLLMAVAGLVVFDSLRVGFGWADDGPRSGYFPFYIGVLLLGASGWIALSQLFRWKQADAPFAGRGQLALVIAVLVPMAVYVVGIYLLGIYVASALLIGYFMFRYGKYRPIVALPVAIGVPLVFFLVFERWFLVPLPKGPIEQLLGF